MLRKDDEKGAVTLSPFQFPSVCLNLDVSRLDFFSHLTLTFDHTALHATAWMFTLSFSRVRWEDNDIMQTCHFPPACRLIRETKLWTLMKSKSFVWWWCISLVIDNLVSLVCTPVYVCVCVCSNEANTPTCRQTPHCNTHTRTHTQCRKWELLLFLWESTSPCSSQSSSILPLLLLLHQFRFYVWHMQLFHAVMGETKLLFFQSHLQQKWLHRECFHANTHNNVVLSLLVTKETKLSSNVGHGCGIGVLTWLLCEQWTIAKKKKKPFRTESGLY